MDIWLISSILLIVGTIALGLAMEKFGASQLYGDAFLSPFTGASPMIVLGGVIALTSIDTQILSSNATVSTPAADCDIYRSWYQR